MMAIVAVVGDAATTTSVAIAAGWKASADVLLVEADRRGGDLAAWLDLAPAPSLSTLVTATSDPTWEAIERHTRLAPSGLRVLTAPAGAAEAHLAVIESARWVVPVLASVTSPTIIADAGAIPLTMSDHPYVAAATAIVVVHRQATQSAAAAAVRLRRLGDQVELLSQSAVSVTVALIGSKPFDHHDLAGSLVQETAVVALPVDPLSAAVYAGRRGVSPRRLARLPLNRAGSRLASTVADSLHSARPWSDHV
jgi:MinD-like ATPase involved in chromosome partitioning or flagellar assembly